MLSYEEFSRVIDAAAKVGDVRVSVDYSGITLRWFSALERRDKSHHIPGDTVASANEAIAFMYKNVI